MRDALQFPLVDRSGSAALAGSRAPVPAPPDGSRFADMLQRGQASHGLLARPVAPPPPPPPVPAAASAHDDAGPEGDGDGLSEMQQASRSTAAKAAKAAPRAREKTQAPAPTAPNASSAAPAASESGATDAATKEGPAAESAANVQPGLMPPAELRDWLAALKLTQQAAPGDASQDLASAAGSAARTGGRSNQVTDPLQLAEAEEASRDQAGEGFAGATSLTAAMAESAVAGQSPGRHEPAESTSARESSPAAPLIGAAGAMPRGFDAGTMAPITVAAAVYSPEFAQVLGAQVSLLAKDGVEQAELHLNPADMGPISVQIEIDGTAARVDFSADTAATREVIERGLPDLAAALREQGLTLAGGGVSQHGQGRQERDSTAAVGRSQRQARVSGVAAAAAIAMHVPAGRLDLYA